MSLRIQFTRLPKTIHADVFDTLEQLLCDPPGLLPSLSRADLFRYGLDQGLTQSFNHWIFARARTNFNAKAARHDMRPPPYVLVGENYPPTVAYRLHVPEQTAIVWRTLARHMDLSYSSTLACCTEAGLAGILSEVNRRTHPARVVRMILNSPSNAAIRCGIGRGLELDLAKLNTDPRARTEQRPTPAAGGH